MIFLNLVVFLFVISNSSSEYLFLFKISFKMGFGGFGVLGFCGFCGFCGFLWFLAWISPDHGVPTLRLRTWPAGGNHELCVPWWA